MRKHRNNKDTNYIVPNFVNEKEIGFFSYMMSPMMITYYLFCCIGFEVSQKIISLHAIIKHEEKKIESFMTKCLNILFEHIIHIKRNFHTLIVLLSRPLSASASGMEVKGISGKKDKKYTVPMHKMWRSISVF